MSQEEETTVSGIHLDDWLSFGRGHLITPWSQVRILQSSSPNS